MKQFSLMQLCFFFLISNGLAFTVQGSTARKDAEKHVHSEAVLKTPSDIMSYALGIHAARGIKEQGVTLDLDIVINGLRDGMDSEPDLLNEHDYVAALKSLNETIKEQRNKKLLAAFEANKKKSAEFFTKNSRKEGVVTLSSGLQYKIITRGSGKSPTKNDTVLVDFVVQRIDKTELDSTKKRGAPFEIQVSKAIKGWQEALPKMREGGTWELYVPSQLAYQEHSLSGVLEPHEALIYKLSLISIKTDM